MSAAAAPPSHAGSMSETHPTPPTADLLQRLGYRDVAHREGGAQAWRESGLALEPPSRE